MPTPIDTVPWTEMAEGTPEDYGRLAPAFESHARANLVPNLLAMLERLRGPKLGYQIDRYDHSLQSASRAARADEPVDLVVAACRDAPHFEACARFCERYDQNCFDPDYPNLAIDDLLAPVEEVFARPSRIPGVAPPGHREEER